MSNKNDMKQELREIIIDESMIATETETSKAKKTKIEEKNLE
jgi:hypothetical protein